MGDFEQRLRSVLTDRAEAAPESSGLADGARNRLRRRRRTAFSGSAVVAVLLVIPVAVALDRGPASDPGPDPATSPTAAIATDASQVPTGWHLESWRDLEIKVPNTWEYGALATWCLNGFEEPTTAVVERPGGVVESIGCGGPQSGYGVRFFDPALVDPEEPVGAVRRYSSGGDDPQLYPEGAWVGVEGTAGHAAILVVARSEYVASFLLGSARRVTGADGNGCSVTWDGPSGADSRSPEQLSVCRYDETGRLVQSERLSVDDSIAAGSALSAAPIRREGAECPSASTDLGWVVIGNGGDLGSVRVVWEADCAGRRGIYFSGVVRELTADVMYWALSPGFSGGLGTRVPLPDQLRS